MAKPDSTRTRLGHAVSCRRPIDTQYQPYEYVRDELEKDGVTIGLQTGN